MITTKNRDFKDIVEDFIALYGVPMVKAQKDELVRILENVSAEGYNEGSEWHFCRDSSG